MTRPATVVPRDRTRLRRLAAWCGIAAVGGLALCAFGVFALGYGFMTLDGGGDLDGEVSIICGSGIALVGFLAAAVCGWCARLNLRAATP